jgi:hypothetical protein
VTEEDRSGEVVGSARSIGERGDGEWRRSAEKDCESGGCGGEECG